MHEPTAGIGTQGAQTMALTKQLVVDRGMMLFTEHSMDGLRLCRPHDRAGPAAV
jgi:hypothetical protein